MCVFSNRTFSITLTFLLIRLSSGLISAGLPLDRCTRTNERACGRVYSSFERPYRREICRTSVFSTTKYDFTIYTRKRTFLTTRFATSSWSCRRSGLPREHNLTRSWLGDRVHTERPSSVWFSDVVNRCRFLSSRLPNRSRDLQPSVVPCRFALRNNNITCVAQVEKKSYHNGDDVQHEYTYIYIYIRYKYIHRYI